MNLEDDLRAALRREPAPPDFAARVLSKTRVIPIWRRRLVWSIAAALAVAAVIPGIYEYRRYERAIAARDQLLLALSITRVQLQQTKEKIQQYSTRHKL
jgi:hypothetical protein